MIGNVQILKNNGESLISNGLAHFKFNDNDKQYLIYTLGEQINELLKIYIGYENAPVTDPGISDEDSTKITDLLKKIGKNEDVSTLITVLPLSEGLYHVHDKVKKVALQTSAFNNIITTQQRGQIQTLDKDEPIMKENTFFDSSLVKEENPVAEVTQEESIFANPMQPIMEPSVEQSYNDEKYDSAQSTLVDEQSVENMDANTANNNDTNGIGQTITNISEFNNDSQTSSNISEPEFINSSVARTNDNSGKNIEINGTISDEEAKNAILAVEAAQATIRENITIIKEFIKQQKNKIVPKTIESSVETKNELNEEIKEIPAMSSQVESLPAQYDVVNNLELAPQPELAENVLSNESNLQSDYLVDTSINQISSEIDTGSIVDTSVSIPRVDLSKQIPVESENELIQQSTESVALQNQANASSQMPLNEQRIPAGATLPIEEQPAMIDTMAMLPHQGMENKNISTVMPLDSSNSEMLDTTNMIVSSGDTFIPNTVENSVDQNISDPNSESIINSEDQNLSGIVPDVKPAETITEGSENQIGISSQNIQNTSIPTIDIQIPDVESENTFNIPETGQFTQEQSNNMPTSIPDIGTQINMQEQPNLSGVVDGEFSTPQIDMNVPSLDQTQAPVIMPDGQSQDDNQGLVLTPDAFNKAA